MELGLDGGVRGGAVSLGGLGPRFWVRGGLLLLMETQRFEDAVGLDRLGVEMSRSGLHRSVLQDSGTRWCGYKVVACNGWQVNGLPR